MPAVAKDDPIDNPELDSSTALEVADALRHFGMTLDCDDLAGIDCFLHIKRLVGVMENHLLAWTQSHLSNALETPQTPPLSEFL